MQEVKEIKFDMLIKGEDKYDIQNKLDKSMGELEEFLETNNKRIVSDIVVDDLTKEYKKDYPKVFELFKEDFLVTFRKTIDNDYLSKKDRSNLEKIGIESSSNDEVFKELYDMVGYQEFEILFQEKVIEIIDFILDNYSKKIIWDNMRYFSDLITDFLADQYRLDDLLVKVEDLERIIDNNCYHHSSRSNGCLSFNVKLGPIDFDTDKALKYYKKQIKDLYDHIDPEDYITFVAEIEYTLNNIHKGEYSFYQHLLNQWWTVTENVLDKEIDSFVDLYSEGRQSGWAMVQLEKNYPSILWDMQEDIYLDYFSTIVSEFNVDVIDTLIKNIDEDIDTIHKVSVIIEGRKSYFETNFTDIFLETFTFEQLI